MSSPTPTGRPTDRISDAPRPTCDNTSSDATTVVPSSEARPSAGRVRRLRERFGERDLAVLQALAKLRLLSGDQVQRLFVANGSPATQARRARALLQRLTDLRTVVRLGRRVGGVRAGSSGFVYGLSGYGQAVLAIGGPVGGRRRRVWETSPSFQDHVLAVAETYVALVEAAHGGVLDLLSFDAEPPCWRRFPGAGGQSLVLKPDAYLRVGVGELECSAFIEVDLGTESAPTIARKCLVYVAYWRSGIEQRQRGVFPRVLWLVRDSTRLARIAAVLVGLPTDARALFHVELLTNAVPAVTAAAKGDAL